MRGHAGPGQLALLGERVAAGDAADLLPAGADVAVELGHKRSIRFCFTGGQWGGVSYVGGTETGGSERWPLLHFATLQM